LPEAVPAEGGLASGCRADPLSSFHLHLLHHHLLLHTRPEGADESHFSPAPPAPSGRTGQGGSSTMALLSRSLPAQRRDGCRSISHPSPMSPLPIPQSPIP